MQKEESISRYNNFERRDHSLEQLPRVPYYNNEGLEKLYYRIHSCKDLPWASVVCDNCGTVVKKDATKLSCLSPYCQDSECVKNRKRLIWAYLKSLKIYSKTMLHIIIGLPRVGRFTRDIQKVHLIKLNLMKKEMKKLGTPLQMIVGRDLNGFSGDLYVHYHCLNVPVKDWRKYWTNLHKCGLKFGFIVKWRHYRSKNKMYKYLAKRCAGVFQNDGDGDCDSFGYNKLMDLKEFYEDFYNTRKIRLFGIRRGVAPSILALLLDNLAVICPNCGGNHFDIVPNCDIDDKNVAVANSIPPAPPPDDISSKKFEVVKFGDKIDWMKLGISRLKELREKGFVS